MISHEIYEFTRFTFAEMRFAGELKGLGDVRIRTKIDRNAPTRQEGLLAMFLHGIGDTDIGAGATILANKLQTTVSCKSLLRPAFVLARFSQQEQGCNSSAHGEFTRSTVYD